MSSSFNIYQQQTDQQFMHMRSEYSSGVGYSSFKDTGEVAVGIDYGSQFKDSTRFQFSAGKNSSATGAVFSMQFGEVNPFSQQNTMDNDSY